MNAVLQYILYLALLVGLAIPLGLYIGKVMNGEKVFLSKLLVPCENGIYKLLRVDKNEEMGWKKYAGCALAFSAVSLAALTLIHMLQGVLPWNPEGAPGTSWHLAFNNAASFVTNTNWQSYSAEGVLSYFTQAFGLTVQNFVSAAVGIAVLFALIRGFVRVRAHGLGSFWVDVTRVLLYVLIPLCFVMSLLLVSQGVIQNLKPYQTVDLVEPITLEDGAQVTQQVIPMGPAASQVAIKQAGTNGGGFNGVNSAHPLENPTPFYQRFGDARASAHSGGPLLYLWAEYQEQKTGAGAIFMAMFILLVTALGIVAGAEQAGTPQLAQDGAVDLRTVQQAGGNMEGKEARFGIATSATWAAFTTAASNGSVNSMHDSYTPVGGMIPMLLMQLGEVVFGGVGCGLYGMIGFAILTVFIAGLMVGRTPEYLGKKIEPYEMKMASAGLPGHPGGDPGRQRRRGVAAPDRRRASTTPAPTAYPRCSTPIPPRAATTDPPLRASTPTRRSSTCPWGS